MAMQPLDSNWGSPLFAVYITSDRLRHVFARCVVLADVPLKEILDSKYAGEGTVLRLRNGRRVRLRGMSLDKFAELTKVISALNAPLCGEFGRADIPPLERTAAAVCSLAGRALRVRRRGRSTALRYPPSHL
jgi:hypothetical protein